MRKTAALVFVGLGLLCVPAFGAEPGLAGRADIVLEDGFEDPNWYQAWGSSSAPQNTSIVSDGSSYRGSSHLRVAVPKGKHYGTSFGFGFAKQGMPEPDEVYFRYAVRLGPTWTTDGGGGGKLPGFGGTYGIAGWGGKPSNGTNGWSARGLFSKPSAAPETGDTRVGFYAYHADMTGQYGSNWYWSGSTLGSDGVLHRSQWYELEVYVKNNTPTQNDGVLRAWADGTQVFEKTDIRFRDLAKFKVERVWFDIYYGGSWTPPADMYIDFDNAVIAWGYIGPTSDNPGTGGTAGSGGGGGSGGASGASGLGGTPASGGASSGGGGNATPAGSGDDDDGGCACRAGRSGQTRDDDGHGLLAALALTWGIWRRRRRSR